MVCKRWSLPIGMGLAAFPHQRTALTSNVWPPPGRGFLLNLGQNALAQTAG